MDTFVGRDNPVHTIRNELSDLRLHAHVRILSISGPGGVGKTFLLNHALSELDLPNLRYLLLRVDGNTISATLADIIIRDLIATAPPTIAGDPQYFRVSRQGWDYLQWMDASARAELESMASDDDALAKIIGAAYDGVVGLLEIIPNSKTRKVTRIAKRIRGRDLERFVAVARRAKA
jgi:AAA ATPase domain